MMVKTSGTAEITERFLEAFQMQPGEDRARFWDSKLPGFRVVIGRKRVSFVVQRRIKGEATVSAVTLGHWAPGKLRAADAGLRDRTLTVARAREAAINAMSSMRSGTDPRGAHAPDGGDGAGGPTLRDGLALHVRNMRKEQCSERSVETIESEVPRLCAAWLDRPIGDLTGAHLVALHDKLTEDGKTYLANRIVAQVSAVWNSLDKVHELSGRNPARAVTRNAYTPKRERVDGKQLNSWFTIVQGLTPVRRDLQLFVLSTGMRSEAARSVRWEHIDFKAGALVVPKPKGGEAKAFTLPLGPRLLETLRARKRENVAAFDPYGGDYGWVFPSLTRARNADGKFEVQPLAEPKEYRADKVTGAKAKILPGLHTLRRTYLSVAAEAGITELDRHVLVNHAYGRQSVNTSYITQSFPHLAECQSTIEAAIWKRLTGKR